MKKTKYIKLAAILLFLIFYMKVNSQNIGSESSWFEQTFTTKKPSNFQLKGFEARAIQKIHDFGDYINLLSNKNYDLKLRKRAIQMFEGLFFDKTVVVNDPEKELINSKKAAIQAYSKAILESKYSEIKVKITDIWLVEQLQPAKNNTYKGSISFKQENQYYTNKSLINSSIETKQVEVLLVKTTKNFGNKKEQVWNVFLGEIEKIDK